MELFRLDPLSWAKVDSNVVDNRAAFLPYESGAIYQIILQNKSQIDLWLIYGSQPVQHNHALSSQYFSGEKSKDF